MSETEKLLIIAAFDDIIIDQFSSTDHLSDEERAEVSERLYDGFGEPTSADVKDRLTELIRKLYEEVSE